MNTENCTIWVDADSFPSQARKILLKKAAELNLKVNYVANRVIPFSFENPLFNMVVVEKSSGSADNYIVENIQENDIAVTRDLPLAKRLIEKNITVMNDRGIHFDSEKLEKMLKDRELSIQLMEIGVNTGARWNNYGNREIAAFKQCLEKILKMKNLIK